MIEGIIENIQKQLQGTIQQFDNIMNIVNSDTSNIPVEVRADLNRFQKKIMATAVDTKMDPAIKMQKIKQMEQEFKDKLDSYATTDN